MYSGNASRKTREMEMSRENFGFDKTRCMLELGE